MSKEVITILTGSGISAESGIPTFRGADGLWENYRVEEVATPEAYESNPELVLDFYNMRRKQLLDPHVKPNAAHYALAKLEKEFDGTVHLITQNIDNLHERAGSKNVIHMHGELLKTECTDCSSVVECEGDSTIEDICPSCGKKGCMRPHVVWFGEMPRRMNEIDWFLLQTNLFIAIGTSGLVYPAAGFVLLAKTVTAKTVEINLEITEGSDLFDLSIQGKASIEVPKYVEEILHT